MRALKLDPDYVKLLSCCPLAPIRNRRQLDRALAVVKELSVAEARGRLSSVESDYLEVLSTLVARYEKDHFAEQSVRMSPAETLQYLMVENNLTLTALADEIGGYKSNLSAFLSGTRGLSKNVAMKLAWRFRVSPDLFLQEFFVMRS